MMDPKFWNGKRVFLTGHTGFKGGWLCLWLRHLGAKVTGYSLPPPFSPNMFELCKVADLMTHVAGDVTDLKPLESAMKKAEPEIVIHLAAQSLVRRSYQAPVETYATNVLGTVHVLDSIRRVPSVRSAVMVTSDKCYQNEEWIWGYRENSPLGGDDPYSGSKGCAEIVTASYRRSFFNPSPGVQVPCVGSARAGNVIGGGDWSEDRLVPDILRSLMNDRPTIIRNPGATRPWQHVLEPLEGYLMLAERLFTRDQKFAGAWNFGPSDTGEKTVGWIVDQLYRLWNTGQKWQQDTRPSPHESTMLKLDASKARAHLGWRPRLELRTTLEWIVNWTRQYQKRDDMRAVTVAEIDRFMAITPNA